MATLPAMQPMPPESLEVSLSKFSSVEAVTSAIMGRGLTFPSLSSDFRGEMPQNITHLDDGAIGDLLSKMSEYCGYAETVLADAAVRREAAEEKLNQTRARLLVDLMEAPRGKMNAEEKSAVVECDPRTVEAKGEFLYWKAFHTLTKVLVDRVQRNWDTISRRITQRGQEVDRMVRGNTMSGRPSQPVHFRR